MAKEKAAKKTGKRGKAPEDPAPNQELTSKELHPVISNGYVLAHFNKPHHEYREGNQRRIGLEFSFPLVKELNGHIPKKAKAAWEWLLESDNKSVAVLGIPPQSVLVKLAPEMSVEADIKWSEIGSASVQRVEVTGNGNAEEVVRFRFRVWAELTKRLLEFAGFHHGKEVWINMGRAQASLLEEKDESSEETLSAA